MMRNPTLLISLGSGTDAWLTVELESLRFRLETENGKATVETLSLPELRRRFPAVSATVAGMLAEAVRVSPAPPA